MTYEELYSQYLDIKREKEMLEEKILRNEVRYLVAKKEEAKTKRLNELKEMNKRLDLISF